MIPMEAHIAAHRVPLPNVDIFFVVGLNKLSTKQRNCQLFQKW